MANGRPRMIGLGVSLLLGLAVIAPAGQASGGRAQELGAGKGAARAALKAARRAAQEAQHRARDEAREAASLAPKERSNAVVMIDCRKVTVAYHGFNSVEGSPNYVVQWIRVRKPPQSLSQGSIDFAPTVLSFTGTDETSRQQIAFPVGVYTIEVHARWNTNGYKGHFTLHSRVGCGPAPAYTIHTLQSIAGSGQAPTAEPLSGRVGQVIDYSIAVQNTGNVPLTFAKFKDRCDPGTVTGTPQAPINPSQAFTLSCSHTLTASDHSAGFYMNAATVDGTPNAGEGEALTQESNTVVVTPVAGETPKEVADPPPPPKTEETKSSATTGASTTSTGSNGGVLSFTSAVPVPALKTPKGCVRRGFVVSIASNGVSSVSFYLDKHRLARLTYRNAHGGLLSVRINPAKLKLGAHHLVAKITMKPNSVSAKYTRTSRQMRVMRCRTVLRAPRTTK